MSVINNKNSVYLDYNATAPMRAVAIAQSNAAMQDPLNASSIHYLGRRARILIEGARKSLAKLVNAQNKEVIWCGSGTEANKMAIYAALQNDCDDMLDGHKIVIPSAIEHPSVIAHADYVNSHLDNVICAKLMQFFGEENPKIAVGSDGVVDLARFEHMLQALCDLELLDRVLFSVMLVNNEIGTIQPVREIAELIWQYNAKYKNACAAKHNKVSVDMPLLHSDASQAVGKIKVDFAQLGADFMTISGHKMGAGLGAAALIVKSGVEITPIMLGGGQEQNKRAGTENVPAIMAIGAVAKYLQDDDQLQREYHQIAALRNRFEKELLAISRNFKILCQESDRAPNCSYYIYDNSGSFENAQADKSDKLKQSGRSNATDMSAMIQLIHADLAGIAISSGSACSSGKVGKSQVLNAVGIADDLARTGIRVSIGHATKWQDLEVLLDLYRELLASDGGNSNANYG